MLTFTDHISAIEGSFSPFVLSREALRDVKQLCVMFPFQFSANFGFETRLGDPAAHCDFFLQINNEKDFTGSDWIMKNRFTTHKQLCKYPVWEKLYAMFREWEQPGTPLNEAIAQYWLEFDYHQPAFNPVPNLFFQLNINQEEHMHHDRANRLLDALNKIYRLLFDMEFPEPLASTLVSAVAGLPPATRVYQVGFMIPRKTEAIRLILTLMRPDEILAYLKKVGWPGEIPVVEEMMNRYASLFDYFVINLYVGQSVLPLLGIELYFRKIAQPAWEPRWHEAFRLLEEDGLVLPEKTKGLLSFCGKKSSTIFYPVHYYNGINHLKLVYKKGFTLECKAYFGTMIRPTATNRSAL